MSKKTIVFLHIVFAIFSFAGIAAKFAARETFLSPVFLIYYVIVLGAFFIYAVVWQQILKRMPLTTAYMNKSVTIVWGMFWGALFFGEQITFGKIIGAGMVIVGAVLFVSDGEDR